MFLTHKLKKISKTSTNDENNTVTNHYTNAKESFDQVSKKFRNVRSLFKEKNPEIYKKTKDSKKFS